MNPYQILGISPSASDDEVKKAYRLRRLKIEKGYCLTLVQSFCCC